MCDFNYMYKKHKKVRKLLVLIMLLRFGVIIFAAGRDARRKNPQLLN